MALVRRDDGASHRRTRELIADAASRQIEGCCSTPGAGGTLILLKGLPRETLCDVDRQPGHARRMMDAGPSSQPVDVEHRACP